MIISHQATMQYLNNSIFNSKDGLIQACSIQIYGLLQKYIMNLKKDPIVILKLDFAKIVDLFEKNVSGPNSESLVAVTACGVLIFQNLFSIIQERVEFLNIEILSDLLSFENQASQYIQQKLSSVNSLSLLQQLIDINRPKSDIKKIDGTNFGVPYLGFYDQPLSLLQKLLIKWQIDQKNTSKDQNKVTNQSSADLMHSIIIKQGQNKQNKALLNYNNNRNVLNSCFIWNNSINMGDTVMNFLLNLSSKTDLSPRGFIATLNFIHDMVTNEQKPFMIKMFKNCLKLKCALIRDDQLLAVQEWPIFSGGGPTASAMIVTQILRIFNIPFNNPFYDKEVEQISGDLAKADIIYLTLNSLKYISKDNISIAISLISIYNYILA